MADVKRHAHCWHYDGGWTNGMGSAGEDKFFCCFCGEQETRPWKSLPDPKHGPFSREMKKVYERGR